MRFITDRIRLVLFGMAVIFLGVINPKKTLESVHEVLDRYVD
jgi:hypothetical protein